MAFKVSKKILFVGRYIEIKGIKELWINFVEIIEEFNLDWELWCVGTGDLWDKRMIHSSIKHFGFSCSIARHPIFMNGNGIWVFIYKFGFSVM